MPRPDLTASAAPAPAAPLTVERDRLIVRPASWFERLDPAALFGRPAALEVELGSGDGSFLVDWARRHPDRNFLGVERLLGRIRKLDRKAQRAGLGNLRCLRIEAAYCVEYLLPPASVAALHVYFPDPWPKRRHHKRRLVTEHFAEKVRQVLEPGGEVHLRTDNTDYFARIRSVFEGCPGFRETPTPGALAAVMTDFEREFNAAGVPIHRVTYLTM